MVRTTPPAGELTAELQDLLQSASHVSIDIFDTLLVRACHDPGDVFRMVGRTAPASRLAPEFHVHRERAERIAREMARDVGRDEVTLEEIYAVLAGDLGLSPEEVGILRECEIELELAVCGPSRFGRALLDRLRELGRPFVLASDMYLPRRVIEAMLGKAGIAGHQQLFLSGETMRSKHSGRMYEDIVRHFGIAPGKILHVGDNPYSDGLMAVRAGLRAYEHLATRRVFSRKEIWQGTALFRGHSALKPIFNAKFVERYPQFAADTQAALKDDPAMYWTALGWLVVAPLVYSLVLWFEQVARKHNVQTLAFLARDGQFPKAAFDLVHGASGIRTKYVAASRRLYTVPTLVLSPTEIRNYYRHLLDRAGSGSELLEALPGGTALVDRMQELGFDLSAPATTGGLIDAIGENSGLLTLELRSTREAAGDYLRETIGDDGRVAIFDLGWRGSLQAAMSVLLPSLRGSLVGIYFGTVGEAVEILLKSGLSYECFAVRNGLPEWARTGCELHTDVIEFLFSADHGSVEAVERTSSGWAWRTSSLSEEERTSQQFARRIQQGALEAIACVCEEVGQVALRKIQDREDTLRDLFAFFSAPTRTDAKMFAGVRVFSGIGDPTGESLTGRNGRFLPVDYARTRWREGFLALLGSIDRRALRALSWLYFRFSVLRRVWRLVGPR